MSPTTVVFDIGGVLIDWQPHMAFAPELGSEKAAHAFLERTDFFARNARGDAGEAFTDMASELDHPDDRALFAKYVTHYGRTVRNTIPGSWEILGDLKAAGRPVHAITNWSAETWPEGVKAHPRLAEVFGVTIVSGQEGVMKPDKRIFEIFCERADVKPSDCVFIDDGPRNVEAAEAFGMAAIRFTGADPLRTALRNIGVL